MAWFALRFGTFIVFFVWALDKVFDYQHNSVMIMHYYHASLPRWLLLALDPAL